MLPLALDPFSSSLCDTSSSIIHTQLIVAILYVSVSEILCDFSKIIFNNKSWRVHIKIKLSKWNEPKWNDLYPNCVKSWVISIRIDKEYDFHLSIDMFANKPRHSRIRTEKFLRRMEFFFLWFQSDIFSYSYSAVLPHRWTSKRQKMDKIYISISKFSFFHVFDRNFTIKYENAMTQRDKSYEPILFFLFSSRKCHFSWNYFRQWKKCLTHIFILTWRTCERLHFSFH